MPINAVNNENVVKNFASALNESANGSQVPVKTADYPADSVRFTGNGDEKKEKRGNAMLGVSLLALAGLGILFRKNISRFLGIGKKAAENGAKEAVETAEKFANSADTVFSSSSKAAKEALAGVADNITVQIAKMKSRTSSLIHNNRQKTLEKVFSDDNWKRYQSVLEAKAEAMKDAGERYARSFDKNADKFKDVMNKMFS